MRRASPPPRMHLPGKTMVSVRALEQAGVDVQALLAGGDSVRRRVCQAGTRTTVVELEDRDVALPLALVPPARDGQWLVFVRRGEQVEVRVDVKATLEGELRFSELMAVVLGPSRPQRRAS